MQKQIRQSNLAQTGLRMLDQVQASPLWTSLACFVSCAGVLGLYTTPWSSMVCCVLWATLAVTYTEHSSLPPRRFLFYLCPWRFAS